jgi:hypothetical protein
MRVGRLTFKAAAIDDSCNKLKALLVALTHLAFTCLSLAGTSTVI